MGATTEADRRNRPADGEPPSRRGRVALVLAAIVVVLVAIGVIVWVTRGPDEVSTDEAIERFRGEGNGEVEPASDARLELPEPGVYTYAADGSESLSVLGTTQAWGPTMPATITHEDDGCWRLRIDYSTHHWRSQLLCAEAGDLVEREGSTYQAFDFGVLIENTGAFTCDPPHVLMRSDADVGDEWRVRCEGTSAEQGTTVTTAGTNTYLGTETLRIDGRPVEAHHYRQDRTLSGDQTGTQEDHQWYSVETGLLLRARSSVEAVSPSPIGDVTYTESGEYTLTSLRPEH